MLAPAAAASLTHVRAAAPFSAACHGAAREASGRVGGGHAPSPGPVPRHIRAQREPVTAYRSQPRMRTLRVVKTHCAIAAGKPGVAQVGGPGLESREESVAAPTRFLSQGEAGALVSSPIPSRLNLRDIASAISRMFQSQEPRPRPAVPALAPCSAPACCPAPGPARARYFPSVCVCCARVHERSDAPAESLRKEGGDVDSPSFPNRRPTPVTFAAARSRLSRVRVWGHVGWRGQWEPRRAAHGDRHSDWGGGERQCRGGGGALSNATAAAVVGVGLSLREPSAAVESGSSSGPVIGAAREEEEERVLLFPSLTRHMMNTLIQDTAS
ncbi:unnamed protein product [Lepidochelys kempii]